MWPSPPFRTKQEHNDRFRVGKVSQYDIYTGLLYLLMVAQDLSLCLCRVYQVISSHFPQYTAIEAYPYKNVGEFTLPRLM